jgi:3-methyladenine DNA glycosylase/8-oxoguanine DNA glycosylase
VHTKIIIPVKKPFDFNAALLSHGWVDLLPNICNEKGSSYSRTQIFSSGTVVHFQVSSSEEPFPDIFIEVDHPKKLSPPEQKEIRGCVQYMLRLDEDLEEFYALCKNKKSPWKHLPQGKGYLLRSPDMFEEFVKVICTTNIQWGGTKRMVRELVEKFGDPYLRDTSLKTFPNPQSILAVSLQEFKNCVRLGYRADYIYLLAKQMDSGVLSQDELLNKLLSTNEIKKRLISLKGVGNYAAATMLMLLGRYDHIPTDTVFRDFMKVKYFQNRQFSEEDGMRVYEEWGKWKYLAYWYDMVDFYHPGEN